MKRVGHIALTLAVFAANIGLDRVTKMAAIAFLKGKSALAFLGNTVIVTYAENSGAFLGMGATWPSIVKSVVLLGLPILLCAAGLAYCLFKERDLTRSLLLVSVIAGGLGNLFDRLFNDFRVVDFLNFGIGWLRTGILNVADLSVTFGAIFLIIYEMRKSRDEQGE